MVHLMNLTRLDIFSSTITYILGLAMGILRRWSHPNQENINNAIVWGLSSIFLISFNAFLSVNQ